MRVVLIPLACLAVVAGIEAPPGGNSATPPPPPQVRLVEVGRFEQPVYVTSPPGDPRLFVSERAGRVWIVDGGRRLVRPFLDVRRDVSTSGEEEGFLSLAFAPDYARSGLFYVDYTDARHRTVIREFQRSRDANRADASSARDVLVLTNATDHHHGGLLLFGPDGKLYIGQGDGGNSSPTNFPAQRLDNLHGKILRIDPRASETSTYRIPDDNPFVGRPGRDEIWVYGLRNPWRFVFDPGTGALVIGDVGRYTSEEIDVAANAGGNYGWNCFEGTTPYIVPGPPSCRSVVPPVLERLRVSRLQTSREKVDPTVGRSRPAFEVRFAPPESVCSIVVGPVVKDPALPDLAGRQLYGDFCESELHSFRLENGHAFDARPLGVSAPSVSSFGVDAQKRVYVTSLTGPVYRLAPSS